jgi:molybdate transport repressor ModE-like protein
MHSDGMFDWDDLKAFLAVARAGSTLAASQALGVSHTTVARRIANLERDLGSALLERAQSGSTLTAAGRELIAEAELIEAAAVRLAQQAASSARDSVGTLRFSTTELVANTAVIPALAEFRMAHPDVRVDLVITDRLLDLEAGEADLAIRTAQTLKGSALIGRKIADHPAALYASRDYVARRGLPMCVEDLADHDLVGLVTDGREIASVAWLMRQARPATVVTRSNSMASLVQSVRTGLGIGVLPTTLADLDTELVRCSAPLAGAGASSWILTRSALRHTPRVRAFMDFMVPRLRRQNRQLEEAGRSRLESAPSTLLEVHI